MQVEIIVTGVIIVALETSTLFKRFMDRAAGNLFQHTVMTVETKFGLLFEQKIVPGPGMRTVANRTLPDADRGMYIHAVKKHLLFLVTGIALLGLRQPEFRVVGGRMRIVAGRAQALLDRLMNVRPHEFTFFMAQEAKILSGISQLILVIGGMGFVAGRTPALGNGFMHVGLVEQSFRLDMTGITQLARGQTGMGVMVCGMGAVTREAVALFHGRMHIRLVQGGLDFFMAGIAKIRAFLLHAQWFFRIRRIVARGALFLPKGRMHGFPKQLRVGGGMRRMARNARGAGRLITVVGLDEPGFSRIMALQTHIVLRIE